MILAFVETNGHLLDICNILEIYQMNLGITKIQQRPNGIWSVQLPREIYENDTDKSDKIKLLVIYSYFFLYILAMCYYTISMFL